MPAPKCSDSQFIEAFEMGGASAVNKAYGVTFARIYERRRRLEDRYGRRILAPSESAYSATNRIEHPGRIAKPVVDGTVLIGSDAHYWPNIVTTAHRAFVKFCKDYKPSLVILNGDVMDGAKISRHASIGWEQKPSVIQEIEAAQERLAEIESAAGRKCDLAWTLGNHDGRFETRLATVAPEYARVHGVHLKDHFSIRWEPCWSVEINNDVIVKHRFKSGIHAPHNNTMWAGKTVVTGHLHSLKVYPFTDYNGDRWGVDTGTMADPYGPQFTDYMEDNPRNWRSGFAVLTFCEGRLLQPELVRVCGDGEVDFRGKVIRV